MKKFKYPALVKQEAAKNTPLEYHPKVNPKDNTITIKRMKESWNREEVVVKVLKMQHDYSEYRKSCHYGPDMREIAEWTDKWIEQNL